jgi:hypothetical protein
MLRGSRDARRSAAAGTCTRQGARSEVLTPPSRQSPGSLGDIDQVLDSDLHGALSL